LVTLIVKSCCIMADSIAMAEEAHLRDSSEGSIDALDIEREKDIDKPSEYKSKLLGVTLITTDGPTEFAFDDHYELQRRIAEGSFGVVYVAKHRDEKLTEEFAVKVIDRKKLTERDNEAVQREVSILRDCREVEGIVRLIDFYSSPEKFYMVQVFAEGGDVFERLATRAKYNEKDARDLAVRLLQAIKVLHERKIAHRDLKPENLLLRSILDDSEILVADFGFATYVRGDGLKTKCGTPSFVAPEVLSAEAPYDERVDCWSVGCLLYMLIGGYPPFQAANHRALFRKIRGADFCFHDRYWKNVSVSAKQLIASLLTVDPTYRATAAMALERSSWLKINETALAQSDLSASISELKKFQARRSLKGAMRTVLWSVRTKFKSYDAASFAKQVKDWDETDEATNSDGAAKNQLLTKLRPTLKFADVYVLGNRIYEGNSCTVWECEHKHQGGKFAVKIVDRDFDKNQDPNQPSNADGVLHEVAVLNSLDHEYIVKIIDFFDEPDNYYLVMERMEGGDVFDRLLEKKTYTERDARELAIFLLEAVGYLHNRGICHRDLKPQNILLKYKDDDSEIKLADFSFACRVHTPQSLTRRCGTPHYVSPEILKNIPYDQSTDMWSVGVILYVILCGYAPFSDDNQAQLFSKVRVGEYDFNGEEWKNVSEDAKDLIRHLLVVDPRRRWSAMQALQCRWLREDTVKLEGIDLTRNLQGMKKKRLSFKHVAKTIIWLNRFDSTKPTVPTEALLARSDDLATKDEKECKADETNERNESLAKRKVGKAGDEEGEDNHVPI